MGTPADIPKFGPSTRLFVGENDAEDRDTRNPAFDATSRYDREREQREHQ
jgi:hypothetical protein